MVVHIPTATVYAHPYNKFWNYGDSPAASIDWSSANVFEKLDGSLMILYWHHEWQRWEVASSGTPLAGGAFGDEDVTFHDVFWETWNQLGYALPDPECTDACFMFELCTSGNRIVVMHENPRIVLHGARCLSSGKEWALGELADMAGEHGWELVRSFPISSADRCLRAASELDPIKCEGFVVVDAQFNRIKIKSPRYVVLHHMKGEATPRRAIELWQSGDAEELLGYFPEMAKHILPIHRRLDELARKATSAVDAFGDLPRKEFASVVKERPFAPVAFRMYGKDPTVDAALAVMRTSTTQALERMLEGSL